jgi:hypothetical protein
MRLLDPTSPVGALMLLAPSSDAVPGAFRRLYVDSSCHGRALRQLQRLRGRVYLEDGAIRPSQLSADGRHRVAADSVSWHLLTVQPGGRVTGCARYRPYDGVPRFEDLDVRASALARQAAWRRRVREAVEGQLAQARRRRVGVVEVGGWAIAPEWRFTSVALEIVLSMFALARHLGGCIGLTTATVRNGSSRILQKLGAGPLELAGTRLPAYYDPHYRCRMEMLRLDSSMPGPKYSDLIDSIGARLLELTVVCPERMRARPLVFRRQEHRATADGSPLSCTGVGVLPAPGQALASIGQVAAG